MSGMGPVRWDPSPDQVFAEEQIEAFLSDPRPRRPWFEMEGIAGTGKTVLLARVARRHRAVLCAFTGKAASNLYRKTGLPATTIHSAIYALRGKETNARGEEDLIFDRKIGDERWVGRLALVDESGTVDEKMAHDLLATGARLVVAGDPGQLKPVKGRQFFGSDVDVSLETVHRQALDSPIIRQAHSVRRGLPYLPDGDAFRVQQYVDRDDILAADVILCWKNVTRKALNALKRAHLGYRQDEPPIAGEPVMCLRNDHDAGVLNGATYTLKSWEERSDGLLAINVNNERGQDTWVEPCWFEGFRDDARSVEYIGKQVEPIGFTWAYCATVHKFQGSEAPFVILVDEYSMREDRERWCYTGITRASEQILVQRNW